MNGFWTPEEIDRELREEHSYQQSLRAYLRLSEQRCQHLVRERTKLNVIDARRVKEGNDERLQDGVAR